MKEWISIWWRSIIYNIVVTGILLILGFIISAEWEYSIYIAGSFFLLRQLIGKPKHYKSPVLCATWILLLFVILFWVGRINLPIALIMVAFCALALSDQFNIDDNLMFAWKNKHVPRAHQDVFDYVRIAKSTNAPNPIVDKLECRIAEENNPIVSMVYTYVFVENRSYTYTAKLLDIDGNEVSRQCSRIVTFFAHAAVGELTKKE